MTAITTDRKTDRMGVEDSVTPLLLSFPVAASTNIPAGALVMTLDGYATNAADGYGLSFTTAKIWGRCEKVADNSTGAAGAIQVTVRPGAYFFANDSSALLALTHIGATAYCKDNATVSNTANGGGTASRIAVGTVIQIRSDGQVAVLIS